MATNPNVEVNRNLFIGGSEISTIMGLNPFQKRGKIEEKIKINQLRIPKPKSHLS